MNQTVALIGYGRLGRAIARGIVEHTSYVLRVSSPSLSGKTAEQSEAQKPAFTICHDNRQAVEKADIVILAVKPYHLSTVFSEIAAALEPSQCLVSVAASVTLPELHEYAGNATLPIVRAMPNVMIAFGQSPTPLYATPTLASTHKQMIQTLFAQLGSTFWLDNEDQMPLATAIVGCGPAFMCELMDKLAEAATHLGWPESSAGTLIQQLMASCCQKLAVDQQTPQAMIAEIATQGGVTEQGLNTLRQAPLTDIFIATFKTALEKA